MSQVNIDMWYGDAVEKVDAIDIQFYPNLGVYRGNCRIKGKYVGDYEAKDSCELEKAFPQLLFNWD